MDLDTKRKRLEAIVQPILQKPKRKVLKRELRAAVEQLHAENQADFDGTRWRRSYGDVQDEIDHLDNQIAPLKAALESLEHRKQACEQNLSDVLLQQQRMHVTAGALRQLMPIAEEHQWSWDSI